MNSKNILECVLERRDQSRDWLRDWWWGEVEEVYRSLKCRTSPILDDKGKEIKHRTNIANPDHFVMVRRGVARLTANVPNLKVTGGTSQQTRDRVNTLLHWQWDKGGEQKVLRQMVHQSKAFGWSVKKDWWDKVEVKRKLRRYTAKLTEEEVGYLGVASQEEAVMQFGDTAEVPIPTVKYEGPVGSCIFAGDIFPEPGFRSLQQSAYVIEYGERDAQWLKYWAGREMTDPLTGEKRKVFDEKAVKELMDMTPMGGTSGGTEHDLRRRMRESVNQSDPQQDLSPKARGKRWCVLEQHERDEECGLVRIDWIGEDNVHLGYLYYPYDLYGAYSYTEMVLIPDLLGGIGDSTPRISRYLLQMRNTRSNQISDFLNTTLRKLYTVLDTADISEKDIIRTTIATLVRVQSHGDIQPMSDISMPPEVWNEGSMLKAEMQAIDPVTADYAPGTSAVPQAGKFATTAVLQQKATDSVTADEIAQINEYLRESLEKRLWMTQQMMNEAVEVGEEMVKKYAVSLAGEGEQVRTLRIDPMEIQEDLGIEPEAGSTLLADDELKKASVERVYVYARENPGLFNVRKIAERLLTTVPGIDPSEVLMPEQTEEGPSMPETKVNISVSVKFEHLPTDVQAAVLSQMGMPTQGTTLQGMLGVPKKVLDAANSLGELESTNDGRENGAGVSGRKRRANERIAETVGD